ncbi:MAG TPA: 50S ribosomal protein L31 [bacterium]|nr:50S ribosomal protein L31 [bacterium]
MKPEIHPQFVDCKVTCVCGNTFMTKATIPEIKTELCSKCHPFFTGQQVLVDTAGQVDRFQKRIAVAQQHQDEAKKKQAKKPKKEEKIEEPKELSNEELLGKIKLQMEEDAKKKTKKPSVKKAAPKEDKPAKKK